MNFEKYNKSLKIIEAVTTIKCVEGSFEGLIGKECFDLLNAAFRTIEQGFKMVVKIKMSQETFDWLLLQPGHTQHISLDNKNSDFLGHLWTADVIKNDDLAYKTFICEGNV